MSEVLAYRVIMERLPPNYQFDYYVRNESGSEYTPFEIIIHAYTKEILYCCSDGPGEGNG